LIDFYSLHHFVPFSDFDSSYINVGIKILINQKLNQLKSLNQKQP